MKSYEGAETLEILAWAKRYNRWIADQFIPISRGDVIDIGVGIGNIAEYIAPAVRKLYVTDIDRHILEKVKKRFKTCPNVRVRYLDITRPVPKRYLGRFDSLLSVNVLEHIKDDSGAMRNMYALVKKGGTVGLLVPAKRWAMTELDVKLGHFRRYEKDEFSKKMRKAGFRIQKIYYFNFVGIISWMIRNYMRKDADSLTSYQIWLFEHVVPALSFVEHYIPVPTGISLVAIAQK